METITSFDQLDLTKRYTYADYLTWQFEERVELIKGWIYKMAAPSGTHQTYLRRLTTRFDLYFENKPCYVGIAPFDVRLPKPKGNKIYTVVQPDLFVVCDPSRIDEAGCDGVPDFIIEIVSPASAKIDGKIKFDLYAEVGVKEYWIIMPLEKNIHQYLLKENDSYRLENIFLETETASPHLFPELKIDLNKIFAKPF